jgi:DNA-binding CsgD family transcriptional regulator
MGDDTQAPTSTPELTDRQREALEALPQDSLRTWGEALGTGKAGADSLKRRLNDRDGVDVQVVDGQWRNLGAGADASPEEPDDASRDSTDSAPDSTLPNLEDVAVGDADPSPEDLTDREEYVARELATGATVEELAADLEERPSVVTQHLRDLRRQGWQVYVDETAEHIAIEGDTTLRSSEHKGTRTRKANRWWETRHNELVRHFRALEAPSADLQATAGHEDWVLHLTDLHAGDRVRAHDGSIVYSTDEVPHIINYATEKGLALAEKHNATYDAAHLLWGGDFVTNEGIYEGQFEDLDAWLDEQVDTLHDPLLRQIKAFAERFPVVNVVGQIGNHGDVRASETSRQANADLLLYKGLRNTVAALQEEGHLKNVRFRVGEARNFRHFPLRGGQLQGHLRHGQDRKPQAETSARLKEWLSTLMDVEFSIAYLGHHHVSGRIPWDGPPVIATGSPKPSGQFVDTLGERVPSDVEDVATAHGVSDAGITGLFPIDTRDYDRPTRPS